MKIAITATLCLLCAPMLAYAHNGGLDSNGCHSNKSKNVYECHEGALQGQTFKSKSEAERRLSAQNSKTGKPAQQTAKVPEAKGKPAQQTAKVPEPADKPTKDTTAAPKR